MPMFLPMQRLTTTLAATLAATVATIGSAAAQEIVMTRAEALARGAAHGPAIAVQVAPRAAAVDARRAANPALIVPPRVTMQAGERYGVFGAGLEAGVEVLQDIPLRPVGHERERAAASLVRSTDANVAEARLDSATRAGLAWVGVLEAQQAFELRKQSLADADELVRLARARVQSGAGQPLELQQALGERGATNASLLDAEGRLVEARAELRFAAGLDPAAAIVATGDLLAIADPSLDEAAAIRRAVGAHPSLVATEARADVARQEERVIRANRAPTISVGASYLREGTADQIWTAVAAVPLPFGDFGAFDRARQRVAADQAQAAVALVRQELARDIRMALHERLHAREVLAALQTGAQAPLAEALRLTRVQYQAGTTELASVLLARQRLFDAEERMLRAAADVQRADLRLQRAMGTLLEGVAR